MYKEKSYWCLQLQFPTQTFPIKRSEEIEKKKTYLRKYYKYLQIHKAKETLIYTKNITRYCGQNTKISIYVLTEITNT